MCAGRGQGRDPASSTSYAIHVYITKVITVLFSDLFTYSSYIIDTTFLNSRGGKS